MNDNKKIAIISSLNFAGKIKEDLWLQEALMNRGEIVDIIPWEDTRIPWQDYKSAILRSAWGYHKNINMFSNFLKKIERSNVKLFNDSRIIQWNIQKDIQLTTLKQIGINIIPTYFIHNPNFNLKNIFLNLSQFQQYESFVIKPIISGSGDNTFLINLDEEIVRHNQLSIEAAKTKFSKLIYNKQITGAMVQPFLMGIEKGEYSFVFIDSSLTHVAMRHPGVLASKKETTEVLPSFIPQDVMNFAQKVQKALNLISKRLAPNTTPVYTRCDIIQNNGSPFLVEAEMAEPDLLIKTISSSEKRNEVIQRLANAVLTRSRT